MYNAIMIFNLNEVAPRTNFEIGTIIVLMTASAMFNAYIFGEMAGLVQQLFMKD